METQLHIKIVCTAFIQVHRTIYELFGHSVQTRSIPAATQLPRRKKSRLDEGLEEEEKNEEEGCRIMVTLKSRDVQVKRESTWTKFVMQKENMVYLHAH